MQLEEVIVPTAQGETGYIIAVPHRCLWELTVVSNDAELGVIVKEFRQATANIEAILDDDRVAERPRSFWASGLALASGTTPGA